MLKLGNICSNFPSSSSRTGRWLSGCFLRSRRDQTWIKVETRAGSHFRGIISPVNILYFVRCTVLLWYYWCQITNICVVVVDTTTTPPHHHHTPDRAIFNYQPLSSSQHTVSGRRENRDNYTIRKRKETLSNKEL